jgi:hypothetical protein
VGITEEQFSTQVESLLNMFGWHWAHFRPARTEKGWRTAISGMGKGFPDYICLRGERMVIMELKSEKGKVSPEQKAWYDKFIESRQHYVKGDFPEVYIWRPVDFDSIIECLR